MPGACCPSLYGKLLDDSRLRVCWEHAVSFHTNRHVNESSGKVPRCLEAADPGQGSGFEEALGTAPGELQQQR